jgi:hypothetical protein
MTTPSSATAPTIPSLLGTARAPNENAADAASAGVVDAVLGEGAAAVDNLDPLLYLQYIGESDDVHNAAISNYEEAYKKLRESSLKVDEEIADIQEQTSSVSSGALGNTERRHEMYQLSKAYKKCIKSKQDIKKEVDELRKRFILSNRVMDDDIHDFKVRFRLLPSGSHHLRQHVVHPADLTPDPLQEMPGDEVRAHLGLSTKEQWENAQIRELRNACRAAVRLKWISNKACPVKEAPSLYARKKSTSEKDRGEKKDLRVKKEDLAEDIKRFLGYKDGMERYVHFLVCPFRSRLSCLRVCKSHLLEQPQGSLRPPFRLFDERQTRQTACRE